MKNNKTFNQLFTGLVLSLGILSTLMLVLPAMKFPDSDTVFKGYEIAFGTEFANLGDFVTGNIVVSIWGILAYLLPLAAALIAVFVKKGTIIAFLLFTLSVVLLLTMPASTKTTVTILDEVTEIDVNWEISYGLIIASISSFLGIVVTLFKLITHAKED